MDDSLYMKYMQEAALRDVSFSKESQIALFKNFLSNILIPPIESAYRRNRLVRGKLYLDTRRKQISSFSYRLIEKLNLYVWKSKQHFRNRKLLKDNLVFPALPKRIV